MTKGKELAKNTMIIVVGKVCTQFISFFLLPLYTSYLNTADYGNVDLINTYINLLIPIVTLQLENAVFRFLIDSIKINIRNPHHMLTFLSITKALLKNDGLTFDNYLHYVLSIIITSLTSEFIGEDQLDLHFQVRNEAAHSQVHAHQGV